MIKIRTLAVLLAALFAAGSCANYYETIMKSDDADLKYKAAFEYYNRGKFRKAADVFENLILICQGTPQEDTVQYYNALSNYKYGDYTTAESGFTRFIEVFPRSPFCHEAEYLRIQCLYKGTYRWELDPMPTRKAIVTISEFMYDNPASEYYEDCQNMMKELQERLDRKSFESAKLYYTMEDYKAASYALRNVLKDNAETPFREDVLYYMALSSYKYALHSISEKQKERYMSFMDDYYNFISEYPESARRKELDNYFARAQKYTKPAVKEDGAANGTASEASKKTARKSLKQEQREQKREDKALTREQRALNREQRSSDREQKVPDRKQKAEDRKDKQ